MIFPLQLPAFARRSALILVAAATALAPSVFARVRPHAVRRARHTEVRRDTPVYKGAIIVDAADGHVLFEDHADEVSPPASMAKLMTFAVLWDKLQSGAITLSTPVKITRSDARMGGTQVYLDPRETFPVEDLIYAMIIQSANDAAHALARFSAGSTEAFVALMNAKARELGMTHTIYRSPNGLPPDDRRVADGDLTSPRDYAILCRYLLLHTDILKYTSVRERDFGVNRPQGPIRMINHNALLGRFPGADGLKTGYTRAAGYCLSATAEQNGHRLIGVIMGSFGPGGRIDYGHARDRKMIELLAKGFAELPANAPNFDAERAKFVQPTAIPVGPNPGTPAGSGTSPMTSPISPAPLPAPAAGTPPADPNGPTIKFSMPN